MAGEALIVGGHRLLRPAQQHVRAAGQIGDGCRQVGVGGGLQPAGGTVPPSSELAPHATHHELRLVVQGPQVRLGQRVRRHLHRVDDGVQRGAGIHHRHHFGHQVLQRGGHVVEDAGDALPPGDRQAVRGEQQFRFLGDHRPQRGGPLDGEALHLLRVARVGEVPDEEVTGREGVVLREPAPQVVVGLAAGVVQFHLQAADVDGVVVADDVVRPHRGGGQEAPGVGVGLHVHPTAGVADVEVHVTTDAAELAHVDEQVPVVGVGVAVQACGDGLVAHHRRRVVAEERAAAHMVGVAVGVDEGAHPVGRTAAQGVPHLLAGLHARGVEAHQPVAGLQGDAVAEALHHRHPVGDLAELVGDTVDGLVHETAVDDAGGEVEQVCHPPDRTPAPRASWR